MKQELLEIVSDNKAEQFRELVETFSEQTLKSLKNIKKKTEVDRQTINLIKEQAGERKLTRYMFYVFFLNECYIMRASKSPNIQGNVTDVQRFVQGTAVRKILEESMTPQERRLLN